MSVYMRSYETTIATIAAVARTPAMAGILARFAPSADPTPTPCDDDYLFDERAAIREFDGKLSRADAECLAAMDVSAELDRFFPASLCP